MYSIKKMLFFGFLSWLIPFIIAIPFYSKDGLLTVDIFLFKSIMIIVGSMSGAFLMVKYFKHVQQDFIKEGFLVGLIWAVINWCLDFAILVPMAKMSIGTYFVQIGLRYLVLLVFSLAFGFLLTSKQPNRL